MHLRGAAAGLVRQVFKLDKHDALQAQRVQVSSRGDRVGVHVELGDGAAQLALGVAVRGAVQGDASGSGQISTCNKIRLITCNVCGSGKH
jgi:hypothetical protein